MTRSVDDADDIPAALRAAADEPVDRVDQHAFGAWYRWRHNRPFWGGLLVLLGGAEILLSEQAPLPVVIHVGIEGLAGYLVPAILLLCGLLLWFTPEQRTFYSILAVLLALGSWITSNLGGFFVGMALGLVGGSLAFAWARGNGPPAKRNLRPRRREPPGGLDLILGGPRQSSRPLRAPGGRRQAAGENIRPIPDEPGLGQDAAAPDQTAPDQTAPHQTAPHQTALGSGPRTGRTLPASPLGSVLRAAALQAGT